MNEAGRTQKMERMEELVLLLEKASFAYYANDQEIMSNLEYDALYDELAGLEEELGIVLANSPTVNVGPEAQDYLPKERHAEPMLSLDKTKDVDVLADFTGDQKALLSWKLDGLTIVLTYRDGMLYKAVTRGNGIEGEVVTENAKTFRNLPMKIPFRGELILRGEAVIHYSDFEKMNAQIPEEEARYKNPRNLCSGSVRQLDPKVTAQRNVHFYAFFLVSAEGEDFSNSHEKEFEFLAKCGFTVVPYVRVTRESVKEAVEGFAERIAENDFPSDGLVLLYDDIAYGNSLGRTAKFPRNAFAFKWRDEEKETVLRKVEWSPSRTGLINPIAVFDPVELEGTTVRRASLHNLSMIRMLELGIGDVVTVYKANMIIPQIARNETKSGDLPIPTECPVCNAATKIEEEASSGVQTLRCTNPECPAKKLYAFTLFVSRDALNIDGLSEATLEKLIGQGMIKNFADLFRLSRFHDEIVSMEGFGEQSYAKLIESAERASHTNLARLLTGLGIPNVGVAGAKLLSRSFSGSLEKLRHAGAEELSAIDTVGPVTAESVVSYFRDPARAAELDELCTMLTLEEERSKDGSLTGLTFVITGSLSHFENRRALVAAIEEHGGKAASSVSAKTDYLINNDKNSNSTKNRTAKELGVPIISEEEFLERIEHAD